ncbi:hypothetical protein BGW41_008204, partial [Actinomortierella wolfii]
MPLDVKAPLDRIAYMLSDSGCKLVVTLKTIAVAEQIQLPQMDISEDKENESSTKAAVSFKSSSTDVAYIMYTSGSTGRPKGVMVSHRAIIRTVINNGFANIGADDVFAMAMNPAFDVSAFDVWAPLLNGGCAVVIESDTLTTPHLLSDALERYHVTAIVFPTALLHKYVPIIGQSLAKLNYLLFGGEQGSVETLTHLCQYGGPKRLINCYGPTETAVIALTYDVTLNDRNLQRLPIGRPIDNTAVYVLDNQYRPVPIGVVGELYIGGPG